MQSMHPIKVPRLIVKGCTIFPSMQGHRTRRTSLIVQKRTRRQSVQERPVVLQRWCRFCHSWYTDIELSCELQHVRVDARATPFGGT